MKKIGFFGVADAITTSGEVTVSPSVGLEMVSGKSFDPGGGGTCAGGAGRELEPGVHVIGTAGAKGKVGCAGAGVMLLFLLEPHPVNRLAATSSDNREILTTSLSVPAELRVVPSEWQAIDKM
jgi:hypothetical protein